MFPSVIFVTTTGKKKNYCIGCTKFGLKKSKRGCQGLNIKANRLDFGPQLVALCEEFVDVSGGRA